MVKNYLVLLALLLAFSALLLGLFITHDQKLIYQAELSKQARINTLGINLNQLSTQVSDLNINLNKIQSVIESQNQQLNNLHYDSNQIILFNLSQLLTIANNDLMLYHNSELAQVALNSGLDLLKNTPQEIFNPLKNSLSNAVTELAQQPSKLNLLTKLDQLQQMLSHISLLRTYSYNPDNKVQTWYQKMWQYVINTFNHAVIINYPTGNVALNRQEQLLLNNKITLDFLGLKMAIAQEQIAQFHYLFNDLTLLIKTYYPPTNELNTAINFISNWNLSTKSIDLSTMFNQLSEINKINQINQIKP